MAKTTISSKGRSGNRQQIMRYYSPVYARSYNNNNNNNNNKNNNNNNNNSNNNNNNNNNLYLKRFINEFKYLPSPTIGSNIIVS